MLLEDVQKFLFSYLSPFLLLSTCGSNGYIYLILSYKLFIERLSQYWLVRGAFSVEAEIYIDHNLY